MHRNILLAVLALVVLLFAGAQLLPDQAATSTEDVPWNITLSPSGNSQILGITLEESRLREAGSRWREAPKVTLFLPESGTPKVEAFFQRVAVGGLSASIVAEISVSEMDLEQLINSGARISTQGDGSRKVTLDGAGMEKVMNSVISSITYLPKSNLSAETIRKRFGEPSGIYPDPDEGVEHWIYPEVGLDIVTSTEGKELFQYVSPRHIERLTAPLHNRDKNSGT